MDWRDFVGTRTKKDQTFTPFTPITPLLGANLKFCGEMLKNLRDKCYRTNSHVPALEHFQRLAMNLDAGSDTERLNAEDLFETMWREWDHCRYQEWYQPLLDETANRKKRKRAYEIDDLI